MAARNPRRSLILLLIIAIVSMLLSRHSSRRAVHGGCTAIGIPGVAECTFISPGARILAASTATSYLVVAVNPNNIFHICLDGGPARAAALCYAGPGSTVHVIARV